MAAPGHDRVASIEQAAGVLVEASAVDFETDRGGRVEIWTISHEGPVVAASGPRLAVARGMQMSCRLPLEDGALHVRAVIEIAEYRSPSRATLQLRVTEADFERHQRGATRLPLGSSASLRALTCGRIVPGEIVAATLHDLSETGVGITTSDSRIRPGDRLQLTARFLEGRVDCELSVIHVARTPISGVVIVGCSILQPNPTAEILARVLARLEGPAT